MTTIVYRRRSKRPKKVAKPATITVPVVVSRPPGKYRKAAEGQSDPEGEAAVREFMRRMIRPPE
jgi:hypothetical protein